MIPNLSRNLCLLLICFFLSGCLIKSLNPFYTKETLFEFSQINGCWKPFDPENGNGKYCFDNNKLSVKTESEEDSFNIHYFMVKGSIYMDATVSFDEIKASEDVITHMAPIHTLYKLQRDTDRLIIMPLNEGSFKKKIETKEISFSFIVIDDSLEEYYINHSSDWVNFLEKFGDDKELFNEEYSSILKRGD